MSKIDVNKILTDYNLSEGCITCKRASSNDRCEHCPFDYTKGEAYIFIRELDRYFIKSHFYFFVWNPEYDWKLPDLPPGINKWNIHHKDINHSNDNKDNLELLTANDHTSLHMKLDNPSKRDSVKELRRQQMKGNNYGSNMSEEARKHIGRVTSERNRTNNPGKYASKFAGHIHSEESRRKISETLKRRKQQCPK